MRRTKAEAMQTRETILNAAAQIMVVHGANAFTIEAVAQQAGVTKGGVLHHFPSKENLINDLIDQVVTSFNTRLMEELYTEPEGTPGRWLRAYIRTVFSAHYDVNSLIPALAAASADPQIMDRIRDGFDESQRAAIQDHIDPVQATIIRLAVDGLVFTRALSVDVLDSETSQKVYDQLLFLTHQPVDPSQ